MPSHTAQTPTSEATQLPIDFIKHVSFVAPLWGFENQVSYVLKPAIREGLWWLQATEDEEVAFLLADPFICDSHYVIDFDDKERRELQIMSVDEALALVMISLPSSRDEQITANFRAPIVFNMRNGLAKQVVSRDDQHEIQHAVNIQSYPMRREPVEAAS